ncbi:MAG TPA: hypothetical protein VKB38_15790 [Terracidiphilus sp.]|nr:hypothetical protein [Terracidiphilus sp.]
MFGRRDQFSLGGAIGHIAVYAFLMLFGFLQLNSALTQPDSYFLFSGPLILIIGIFGVFHGLNEIPTVHRRSGR